MKKVLFVLAALAVSWTPALAQDEAPADVAEAAQADPAAGADVAAEDDSATEAEKVLEKDMALFWGQRRQVEVVQKRLYEKDGRFEASLYGGIIPNDDFIVYYPTGIRAGYHFSEAFQVEASFAYAIDVDSDLAKFLVDDIGLKRADIQEYMQMYYNVDILWAPIYGKISLLGAKLAHFETFIGVGFGAFHTKEFPETNPEGNDSIKPGGNTILGFRWFINENINVRTEYRHYFFEKFGGGVSSPVELTLGLGIMI
ncbi:MAG: outer membrane beta-barrel domain-containing protein [Myxococcales bacterium]|nr:outer membrane beta-barrel domain-containing protein [Myxococcales bacterium]MCB9545048.1 outer membrane beta-barrel domain-containing protein [Myxococcales bacterium]